MSEIVFDLQLPCSDDELRAHVNHALGLGLPETQVRKTLTVVANGPSAKSAPLDGITLALNGALKLFTAKGLAPTYCAVCDPQALVADFFVDPPEQTIYLVASKCHPLVFEMLQDRNVLLWHVADQVVTGRLRAPLACSVTMCAMWELSRPSFGFTDFDVWGWDGAYLDNEHHAGSARIADSSDVTVEIAGQDYQTTRAWAAEVFYAQQFLQIAEYLDLKVTINGGGMVAAAQAHLPRAA